MPTLPTPGDVHVNRPLTNIAIAFTDNSGWVFNRAFPMVPVMKQSDTYYVWNKGDFHRDEAEKVGPGGAAPIGALRISTDSYNCDVYKFAHLVSDQERANQDDPLDLDMTKSEDVTRKLMIRMEKDWAAEYFTTGKWTGSTTATDIVPAIKWDVYATSDPIADIRTQLFHMAKLGLPMSEMKLTLGADVFKVLLDHPKFLERYEQVQASILNEQLMASVLGIGEVIVPMSVVNNGPEAGVDAFDFIHGDAALLTYSPSAPSLNRPSAGYCMKWAGLTGGQGEGIRIKRFRRDVLDSDQIQGESAWDHKLVSSVCGVFFDAVLT